MFSKKNKTALSKIARPYHPRNLQQKKCKNCFKGTVARASKNPLPGSNEESINLFILY